MGERRWRERAACLGRDPELFFPTAETGPAWERQVAAAKAVCADCPVGAQCLTEALTRLPYGIAGGLTEQERHRLRRTSHPQGRSVETEAGEPVDAAPTGSACGINRRDRAGTGRALLAAGRTPRQVAALCGVTTRTAERWARDTSTTAQQNGAGEGSRGGNRAPLRISTARHAWADDTTPEGHRG